MSQSEFATHTGNTRSYITQLKNAGRLVMEGKKVNVEASIKRIAETQDPGKVGVAARHEKDRQQKQASVIDPEEQEEKEELEERNVGYQQARAMRENYNALQAKIAYEKEIGLLLVASEAKMAVASGDAVIRNRLESLPDMLAPQLAAESDEQKIRAMLMDHIESMLSDLSRGFNSLVSA
ncbi:MAG: hypothetical protein ACXV8Q_03365 [Methylobacter sp.]